MLLLLLLLLKFCKVSHSSFSSSATKYLLIDSDRKEYMCIFYLAVVVPLVSFIVTSSSEVIHISTAETQDALKLLSQCSYLKQKHKIDKISIEDLQKLPREVLEGWTKYDCKWYLDPYNSAAVYKASKTIKYATSSDKHKLHSSRYITRRDSIAGFLQGRWKYVKTPLY